MKNVIYTNIGFEAVQYKMLKHIAVERHISLANLIREAISQYLRRKTTGSSDWERDYFFRFGPSLVSPNKGATTVNLHDQIIYGL